MTVKELIKVLRGMPKNAKVNLEEVNLQYNSATDEFTIILK